MTATATKDKDVAPPPAVQIRMDRSRAHSEIHGSRMPGDPHYGVHYYQDGLPHDAQGFLITEHSDYEGNSADAQKRRATLEKKMRKATAAAAARKVETALDEGDEDGEEGELEPINLDAWVRGQQALEWIDVTQAIAQRYKKRISKIDDAVPFLVDEMKIPASEVAKKFQKFL